MICRALLQDLAPIVSVGQPQQSSGFVREVTVVMLNPMPCNRAAGVAAGRGRTMHSTDRLANFGHSICMCIFVASNHDPLPDCRVMTGRRTRSWWTGASGRDATCDHHDLIRERAGLFHLVFYACGHPHGNEGWINGIHLDTDDRWRPFAHTFPELHQAKCA